MPNGHPHVRNRHEGAEGGEMHVNLAGILMILDAPDLSIAMDHLVKGVAVASQPRFIQIDIECPDRDLNHCLVSPAQEIHSSISRWQGDSF